MSCSQQQLTRPHLCQCSRRQAAAVPVDAAATYMPARQALPRRGCSS